MDLNLLISLMYGTISTSLNIHMQFGSSSFVKSRRLLCKLLFILFSERLVQTLISYVSESD